MREFLTQNLPNYLPKEVFTEGDPIRFGLLNFFVF